MNLDQVTSNELGSKTLTQLRDIAKEIGIKSVSKYKKNELIELINENIKKQEPVEVKTNIAQENKKDENVENKSYERFSTNLKLKQELAKGLSFELEIGRASCRERV